MPLPFTDTYAGNDSDGRIWGIDGTNLIIILIGGALSLGLIVVGWIKWRNFSFILCILSLLPFLFTLGYVFCLRQGKPKAFDTDFMETLIAGRGWVPDFCERKEGTRVRRHMILRRKEK